MVKIAVASTLLVGAAMAVPYPPSINEAPGNPVVPATVDFSLKGPGMGNFMPSDAGKTTASKTTDAPPAAASKKTQKRVANERVTSSVARFDNSNITDGVGNGVDRYITYRGDGSTGAGWPAQSSWVSFENMFNNYKPQMLAACGNMSPATINDSHQEIGAIWDGIQMAQAATGVDHRFILAVIMQESHGCVRTHTTNFGVRNPGLMQDHNGSATCNENDTNPQNPCPSSTIYQMIQDGTGGTSSGDGLANCINQSGRNDVSAFYRAARIYNSGSISSTGQLQNGIATHCYASDIANRLTGWVNAPSQCNCDSNPSSCGIVTN